MDLTVQDAPVKTADRMTAEHVVTMTSTASSSTKQPQVSIVVPAHNEQNSVVHLLEEFKELGQQPPDLEVIIVDDGSLDNTLSALSKARRDVLPMLRIFVHERSAGQSTALLTGVQAAHGCLIVTLDADGQNVPADIPAMLALARAQPPGTHFCIAGHTKTRHDTLSKRWQSRIDNAVRSAILKDDTPDTGCALKVMPRDTWLMLPGFDHMHRFLPALVQQQVGQVLVHAVQHRPRLYDQSKYGMIDRLASGLIDMLGVIWLARRTRSTSVHELES